MKDSQYIETKKNIQVVKPEHFAEVFSFLSGRQNYLR